MGHTRLTSVDIDAETSQLEPGGEPLSKPIGSTEAPLATPHKFRQETEIGRDLVCDGTISNNKVVTSSPEEAPY